MSESSQQPVASSRRGFWTLIAFALAVASCIAAAVLVLAKSVATPAASQGAQTAAAAALPPPFPAATNFNGPNYADVPEAEEAWTAPYIARIDGEELVRARHQSVDRAETELRELATAHRDALAALAGQLAASADMPPNQLCEQLETEGQKLAADLSACEALVERIALCERHLTRLTELQAEISRHPADGAGDPRDLGFCIAARAEAALGLAREKYRDQLSLAEVQVLEEHVARMHDMFQEIDSLYMVGARGGEAEKWTLAGYELFRAGGIGQSVRRSSGGAQGTAQGVGVCVRLVQSYSVVMGGPPDWPLTDLFRSRDRLVAAPRTTELCPLDGGQARSALGRTWAPALIGQADSEVAAQYVVAR